MIQYDTIQVVVCFYARKTAEFGRAFMCGVRTYLNLSLQLLPLLGTKAKYVRENTVHSRYFVHSQYFGFILLHASEHAFASCISGLLMWVLQVSILLSISSVGSYCEYSQYRNTLNMLSNTWSMKYTSTVCAPRVDNSQAHCSAQKSLTDGSTSGSWSKLLSMGATGILRALAVLREYVLRGVCTASILSVSRCYVYFTLSAKKHLFCGNIFCMCWILLSRSQSIMC